MALDSVLKRASAINIQCPWRGILPIPDNDVEQPDRQVVSLFYSGITAGEPVEPPVEVPVAGGGFYYTQEEYEAYLTRLRTLDNARKRIKRKEKEKWQRVREAAAEAINPRATAEPHSEPVAAVASVAVVAPAKPPSAAPDPRLTEIIDEMRRIKAKIAEHEARMAEEDDLEALLLFAA
jgi:hypothetical protein